MVVRSVLTEAHQDTLPVAAVLVDVSTEHRELYVGFDSTTGWLTAVLRDGTFEACGSGPAVLRRLSPHTAIIEGTVALRGVDPISARPRELEASMSVSWTTDRRAPIVEVAGTGLVTDLDRDDLVRYRAVRSHPANRFETAEDPTGRAGAPSSINGPGVAATGEDSLCLTA